MWFINREVNDEKLTIEEQYDREVTERMLFVIRVTHPNDDSHQFYNCVRDMCLMHKLGPYDGLEKANSIWPKLSNAMKAIYKSDKPLEPLPPEPKMEKPAPKKRVMKPKRATMKRAINKSVRKPKAPKPKAPKRVALGLKRTPKPRPRPKPKAKAPRKKISTEDEMTEPQDDEPKTATSELQ